MAGSKLGIVVVRDVASASQLLPWLQQHKPSGRVARIWPLESLSAANHQEAQRKTQAAFPEGPEVNSTAVLPNRYSKVFLLVITMAHPQFNAHG